MHPRAQYFQKILAPLGQSPELYSAVGLIPQLDNPQPTARAAINNALEITGQDGRVSDGFGML
jgi:hypothetical protein